MNTTTTTFKTKDESLRAGWTRGSAHKISEHRGIPVMSVDVSGAGERGYEFEIQVLGQTLATAQTVYLSDSQNAACREGSIIRMYAPGVADSAAETAVRIIDKHLMERPDDRPHAERIEEARSTGETGRMYAAMVAAANDGHPQIAIAKGSGEPYFKKHRHEGSGQLALLEPDVAKRQLLVHGVSW